MPIVKKQTMRRSTSGGGVLDRIRPVSVSDRGIKFCVYGRGKTGKTRLASTFPKPLLIIGTEDGTRSVATTPGLDFFPLKTSSEIDEIVDSLGSLKYKTLVLDTAGGLQDMVLKEILGLEDLPVQKTWGIAKQQDWGTCGAQTKERLRRILDTADQSDTNVVVIAHERNFDGGDENDLIFPTVGAALTPSVAGWLNGACDYIGQTFIRESVTDQEITIGKKTVTKQKKTGGVDYCLRVGPHPVYMTGFRVPEGVVVPDAIVDPHYDKIIKLIKGK